MNRVLTFVCVLAVGCMLLCNIAWAQATGQISGTVKDASGAVLPGAAVTVTETQTGASRNTTTNESGFFTLTNLAVGSYRLEATLAGFQKYVQTGIVLRVDDNLNVSPTLAVGQVSEQVEVQANAAQVETRSTQVGQVIENEKILELPLNGRNVTDLIGLAGAAYQVTTSSSQAWQGGVLISIAGGLNFGVGYVLDGAMHINPYDGSQMPLPFPDALQEFKVEDSGSSANGAAKSGGAVTAVTKSGTNQFHGDLFEFVRNYKFNAQNTFATTRDTLKRNQYGGTVGGPILKNKLFFFGAYQGTKTRSDPTTSFAFVPTAAMLAGDWSTFASAACNAGKAVTLKAPFTAGNKINPSAFNAAAMNIAAKLPVATDPCGKVPFGLTQHLNQDQAMGRFDYQRTPTDSIFGRYLYTNYELPNAINFAGGDILASTADGYDNIAQSGVIGDTHVIGANIVNAFRLSLNRTDVNRIGATFFGPQDVGIDGFTNVPGQMEVTMTGGFNLGESSGPGHFTSTTYQLNEDLTYIRGNHQLAFGTNVAQWRNTDTANRASLGIYSFNGSVTGLGLADFMTGKLASLNDGSPTDWRNRQTFLTVYGQDTWKMTPKVTFTYGVRWEPYLPLHFTTGALYNFDPNRYLAGVHSQAIPSAPAGLYFPGDPGFPANGNSHNKLLDFAPRVGLAWDVSGDGKTSVRASFGEAYDYQYGTGAGGGASSPPYAFNVILTTPSGGLSKPWSDFPGSWQSVLPWVFNPSQPRFTPQATFHGNQTEDMRTPQVQSWNLSIQRQLPSNIVVSATYLGSHTIHLWVQTPLDNGVFIPGNAGVGAGCINPVTGAAMSNASLGIASGAACSSSTNTQARRLLTLENPTQGPSYGLIAVQNDGGTSNYNGLLLSAQRPFAHGISVNGNFTWAHCIGNNYDATGPGAEGQLIPGNRYFEIGNCISDHRYLVNLTPTFSTPKFENTWLRRVVTGWRLAEIYTYASGDWQTVVTGTDRALVGINDNQRPNQVLDSPYGTGAFNNYYNPNAFVQPALGSLGNMRPFSVNGPGHFQLNSSLTRSFNVHERQTLEFRVEAFNITNSVVRLDPGSTPLAGATTVALNSNTFGQITASGDPRIMQFALKYTF